MNNYIQYKTIRKMFLLSAIGMLGLIGTAYADCTVVTTIDDGSAGSLRTCIDVTNAAPGAEIIDFNLNPAIDPGYDSVTGAFTINLASPLPAITDAVTIDGSTQTTATGNTNTNTVGLLMPVGTGPDAIEANGDEFMLSAFDMPEISIDSTGMEAFLIMSDNVILKNMTIKTTVFNDLFFLINTGDGFSGIKIQHMAIGIADDGDDSVSAHYGFRGGGSTEFEITDSILSSVNFAVIAADGFGLVPNVIISRNRFIGTGIRVEQSTSDGALDKAEISNNYFDQCEAAFRDTGAINPNRTIFSNNTITNCIYGIFLAVKGSSAVARQNVFKNNTSHAIFVKGSGNYIVLQNAIYNNGGMGINLTKDDVTPNDAGDLDTGPNNLLNFPVANDMIADGTNNLQYDINLDTINGTYIIEFYTVDAVDANMHGEGQEYIGAITVNHSNGNQNYTGTLAANKPINIGDHITMTTTISPNLSTK